MELWAAVRLVTADVNVEMLVSIVAVWKAPSWPRSEVTLFSAAWTIWPAFDALFVKEASLPEPISYNRPTVPPSVLVSTLWMPRLTCWAEVTVGPSWNRRAAAGDVEIDILTDRELGGIQGRREA